MKTTLIVIALLLMIIALQDLIRRQLKYLSFNFVWLAIVLFIPVIGPIVYLVLKDGMSAKRKRRRTFNPNFHHRTQETI